MLRFIVEALLYSVGIRPELPNPIRTALNEKDQIALEQFKETHDTEFSVMADSKKLAPWLDQRFETIVQDRQKRFEQSIEKHEAKKEAARRKIEQLSALLNTKNCKLKHQIPINSSRPHNPTSFPAPNPQPKHPTSDTPSPL